GSLAVLNAMNGDDNLLAVDVKTGELRWRQRPGHYFPFAPQGLAQGLAAQGFDFASAERYHLHLGALDGGPRRRFALTGSPQTLPAEGGRAVTVAPDGSRIAFVAGNQLKLCSLADGLQWILPADDTLHAPRFSPDGKRIVVCSDLGSVYVAGSDGRLLCQRD